MAHINTFTSTLAYYGQVYNLQSVDSTTLRTLNIFVNSVTGIDGGPGRGTSASAPYKNLEQALKDAFALSTKFQVIINLAGALPHALDDGYVFPLTSSADQITTDTTPSFGFTQQGPLVIRADPTALTTILLGAIVGQADNAISGLKEITTAGGFVVGAFDGKWMRDANGVLARIKNNTAAVFNLCYAGADLVAPLVVQGAGATITPAVPASSNPTVVLRGGSAPIVFFGVDITASAGGALQVGPNQQAIFVACGIPSMELGCGADTQICGDAAIEAFACKLGSMAAPQAEVNLQNCLMTGGSFSDLSAKTSVFAAACAFTSMGPLFFDGDHSVGLFTGGNLFVGGSLDSGVFMRGGTLTLSTCDIAGNGTNGIVMQEGATGSSKSLGSSVDNGGFGIVCDTSSRFQIDGTVNGAANNDLSVGGLPSQSWASFNTGILPFTRFSAAQNSAVYTAPGGTSQSDVKVITFADTPYAMTPVDSTILANAALGAISITLPNVISCFGRKYTFKKTDASINIVTIFGFPFQSIDGSPSVFLPVQFDSLTMIANATGWSII